MLALRTGEAGAVALSALLFYLLMSGYYILRPIRDEMGIAGGEDLLHTLFLVTLAVIGLASGKDAMAAFDTIASIVAMFFLCTYGMINLAAFVESFGGNPSFRPRFRLYHWTTSLLGFLACAVVMAMIDAKAAMVAVLVILILYVLISRRVFSSAFGDARRGFQYSLVVRSLQKLRNMDLHPKNWRPSFLVMGGASAARLPMIK